MTSLISIIVPIYNVEKYLPLTLDCILAQTYQEIEIILIDDGSTDSSGEICEKYASLDTRIRLVRQENQGVSAARNKGLAMAKGKYIGFVDSDDMPHAGMFQALCSDMENLGSDMAICDTVLIDEDSSLISSFIEDKETTKVYTTKNASFHDIFWRTDSRKFYCIWDKLFKREIIESHALHFHPDLRLAEDTLFTLSYLLCCQSISINSNPFYNHRIRQGSLMRSPIPDISMQRVMYIDAFNLFVDKYAIQSSLANEIRTDLKKHLLLSTFQFARLSKNELRENILFLKTRRDMLEISKRQSTRELLYSILVWYFPISIATLLIFCIQEYSKR